MAGHGGTMNSDQLMSSSGISEKEKNLKNTPHGSEPLKCDVCSFSCSYESHLLKHLRVHTNERPFKCKQCSYNSSLKCNLVQHQRIHTREKPYLKCKDCSYVHMLVLK